MNTRLGAEITDTPAAGLEAPHLSGWLVVCPTALALAGAVQATLIEPATSLAPLAAGFMVAWLVLSLLFSVLALRHFVLGFLGGLLFLLAGWRIAGPLGLEQVIWPAAAATALYIARYVDAAIADIRLGREATMSLPQWHLTFLRIYFGFDMVPHFTEKLFAGPAPFRHEVEVLGRYGMNPPVVFVLIGGLCELAIAFGLGMGFLTRLAGAGAALYFFIASMVGNHFAKGFTWNQNGGGWEYPLLMLVLYLSFVVTGGGAFSLDGVLAQAGGAARGLSGKRSNVTDLGRMA